MREEGSGWKKERRMKFKDMLKWGNLRYSRRFGLSACDRGGLLRS